MLEGLAYAGWWFRELIHIVMWWVCVGYPQLLQELDKRRNHAVVCEERKETYD